MNRAYFSLLVISIWAVGALSAFGAADPNTLFQQASLLESKGENAQAAALYQQLITEFPTSSMAGPDYAGYHVKFIALREALSANDLASAKTIAAQIKALASSPEQKANQLVMTAGQLETKVELLADAAALYQQVIAEFPASPMAGPDYAAFNIKFIALREALSDSNLAPAKVIAAQIKALASSPQQKASQLVMMAGQLETKTELLADAVTLYQQVITDFPASPFAGPDYAGFRVKVFALDKALADSNFVSAKVIAEQIKALASSPQQKPDQLYSTASRLESKEELLADAATLYQEVITEFPDSPMAGPDYAGFNVKFIALRQALSDSNLVSAKAIADEIKALASSPQQKPDQLYGTAGQLESRVELFADAAALYQQVITECPNSPMAGPDYAAFNVNFIALRQALASDDLASATAIAAQIKALASSPQQKAAQLAAAAGQLETKVELFADAAALYRQVIDEFPDSPFAGPEYAGFRVKIFAFCDALADSNLASAKAIADQIKAEYANAGDKLTAQLFAMAEEYYTAGLKHEQSEFFRQSIDMYEKDILTLAIGDREKATAFYVLGLNYNKLGMYAEAAMAFETSYAANPKFIYADYCLFAAAYYLDQANITQQITDIDENQIIEAYQEFLGKYPDSKYRTYPLLRIGEMLFAQNKKLAGFAYLQEFKMIADVNDCRWADAEKVLEYYGNKINE